MSTTKQETSLLAYVIEYLKREEKTLQVPECLTRKDVKMLVSHAIEAYEGGAR